MSDIRTRLLDAARCRDAVRNPWPHAVLRDASDEIDRLREQAKTLRIALKACHEIIVEIGTPDKLRQLTNEELGRAWIDVFTQAVEALAATKDSP